jgi:hypothetical protein
VKAIARVVRIYGSTSQYRDRDERMPAPLEASGYPASGDTLRVWFGPVPDEVSHQLQVLVAKANTRLNSGVLGQAGGDDVIDRELEKVIAEDQVALDDLYYVTIAVDRPVMLPDEALLENRYEWIDPRVVEPHEDSLTADAAQAIDMAVAAMAPKLAPNRLISRRVVGRSYVFAVGHEATSALRFRGSATGIGVHPLHDLPLNAMRERLAALPQRRDWHAFELAGHWYESMLQENDDELKRFLWGFIALETLTNTLYDRLYDTAVATLRMPAADGTDVPHQNLLPLVRRRGGLGLAERFDLVSGYLSPATAEADAENFRRLKAARDRISHGGARRETLDFPTDVAAELLPRYFELAFDSPASRSA